MTARPSRHIQTPGIFEAARGATDDGRVPRPHPMADVADRAPVISSMIVGMMVGQGRFELPTSRLSSARSNQLSY